MYPYDIMFLHGCHLVILYCKKNCLKRSCIFFWVLLPHIISEPKKLTGTIGALTLEYHALPILFFYSLSSLSSSVGSYEVWHWSAFQWLNVHSKFHKYQKHEVELEIGGTSRQCDDLKCILFTLTRESRLRITAWELCLVTWACGQPAWSRRCHSGAGA